MICTYSRVTCSLCLSQCWSGQDWDTACFGCGAAEGGEGGCGGPLQLCSSHERPEEPHGADRGEECVKFSPTQQVVKKSALVWLTWNRCGQLGMGLVNLEWE